KCFAGITLQTCVSIYKNTLEVPKLLHLGQTERGKQVLHPIVDNPKHFPGYLFTESGEMIFDPDSLEQVSLAKTRLVKNVMQTVLWLTDGAMRGFKRDYDSYLPITDVCPEIERQRRESIESVMMQTEEEDVQAY